MALTYGATAIQITGPSGIPTTEPAEIVALDVSHGENWGVAMIRYPSVRAAGASVRGQAVNITVSGTPVFSGHVVRDHGNIGEGADDLLVTVNDVRWDMARQKTGQYGVGDLHPTLGGFATVGYRLHFNPAGQGNRTVDPDEDGFYGFTTGADAVAWTRRQILEFLLHWYYPAMTAPEDLPATWAEVEPDFRTYLQPLPAALTALALRAGCSWAPRYAAGDNGAVSVSFHAISSTPTSTVTLDLPAAGTALAADSSASSIVDLNLERSIVDAVDIVEVHTANTVVECVYSNHGTSPLLVGPIIQRPPPGFACFFTVDVANYGQWGIGRALAAGSLAKRWLRTLATRVAADGSAYLSDQATLKAGHGVPLRPEECCWIGFEIEGQVLWSRVLRGVTILHDQGTILLEEVIATTDNPEWNLLAMAPADLEALKFAITLATYTETNYLYRTGTPSTWHIDAAHPIVHAVPRSDFQPLERYTAWVPTIGSTDPAAITVLQPSAKALYIDIEPELALVHNAIHALRSTRETTGRVQLLGLPAVQIGDKVEIGPADCDLTGREIVAGIKYDLDADQINLTFTSNLARLVTNDL